MIKIEPQSRLLLFGNQKPFHPQITRSYAETKALNLFYLRKGVDKTPLNDKSLTTEAQRRYAMKRSCGSKSTKACKSKKFTFSSNLHAFVKSFLCLRASVVNHLSKLPSHKV